METMRNLDYEEQAKAHAFGKEVVLTVTQYMSTAIEAANRAGGVKDEEFWNNLFVSTRPDKQMTVVETGSLDRNACPENPYEKLDFQGCNKYLLFGGQRLLREENGCRTYAKDSFCFFQMFGVDYTDAYKQRDGSWVPGGPKGAYRSVLNTVIRMRNKYAHDNISVIREVTLESLKKDLDDLRSLTQPITRKRGWEKSLKPVQEFWKETDKRFRTQFGFAPLSLDELSHELFVTEEALTSEQSQAISEAVEWLRLDCRNGTVYGEDRRGLMEKLRHVPAIADLLGTAASRTPEEAAAQAGEAKAEEAGPAALPPLPQPLWKPLESAAAAVLRRAGAVLPLQEKVLSTLLDSFTLLVDESIFLSEEGRELLTEHLAPLLMKRHQRLYIDESVITTLFRQFRSSVPYTDLELSELEPDQAPQLQELRRQLHKSSKTAIKTLRFLRKRKCLEVAASPTDSPYSYENFFQLAQSYPAARFFVLTLDRQLAEELKEVYGRNVVAAKPGLDGQLLPFRATRPVYQAMLEPEKPSEAPDMPKKEAAPAPVPPDTRAARTIKAPVPGQRLTGEWPDGNRLELRLGKELGRGGEGMIFETSLSDTVAKVYFQQDPRRLEKLRCMVGKNPGISGLCWPQALLYTADGEWVGYLMPRAVGRELALTVFHPGRNNSTITAQGWTRRSLALIAANIAATFARMHEKGILMGDVNPRNFLITPECNVYLVDCDSYQFDSFACPVGTILYTPPEIHRQMRSAGRENYGYIRTEDNERYSLAVLLFEILMLGKAPYESRNNNNQDVQEAIIAGDFPYPYHSDDDDEADRPQGKLNTPVGQWRQIWSNTTYLVKTGFYNTFTGKNRLSAAQWAQTFREYARQIELGHSSDELVPHGYKDTSGREGDEGTRLVNLKCEQCGRPFNLGEDVWRRRKSRGEPDLCSTHWEIRQNFLRREKVVSCGICGTRFPSTVADWMERTEAGKPMICPDCQHVSVRCSRCGRSYTEKRERMEELQSRQVQPLCPDCFDIVFPRTVCESCGETFRPHQEWLESRRRYNRPILCKRCQNRQTQQNQ